MDDDPEPTVDQMILESHEANEQLLSFREPKCAAEIGEESTLESGDIGPFVDPESPKKPVSVKDLPVQTDSKTSIFRRKEWMDQGQQVDLPDSVKSSSTSLRKLSRRNSQRSVTQDSRRSSQQPPSQLPVLSQKSSRGQVVNEADMKDSSFVSLRTGKVMTCRSQQTSQIWERKALSEILHPSTDESVPSKEEESEITTVEDDLTSSGETPNERYPRQESRQGSKQLEGKISKHSSQQRFERYGSRRSSQRSSELPYALSPKYSRVRASTGTDTDEDVTWISQKTGREMKCKAQQTSQIWGSRVHSGVFSSSRRESQVGREEESGFTTTDEVPSSGETGREESTVEESSYSSQREGGVSEAPSWQQFGRPEAHRRSQPTTEQPSLLHLKSSRDELAEERTLEEKPSWTSQRAGKDMKCQSQQTSLVWEQKTLSEIMTVHRKASDVSILGGEDTDHQLEQAEEQKPELLGKKQKSKIDQALQTDSCESIKKELEDSGQQTDISEGVKMSLVDLRQTPSRGSRRSSKELTRRDSSRGSPKRRDSQRSSQQSLQSKTKAAEEEPRGPSDIESKPPTPDQKASEETTWVSQKTGRLVKNQSQQTDRSWLQYFALKSQKLKRSISQQTEESFLQWYKSNKLKQVCREHRRSHVEPDMRRCTVCGDMYGEDFTIDLDMLPSFSTMSSLSTISSEETTEAESFEERELSVVEGLDERPQTQQPLRQDSEGGNQEVGGEETPKAVDRESQQGSLKTEDDQASARPADELEDESSSYTEGEDKIQQTYSMISFEDGIWLNRKTGKLLVTHSQQTSETSVPKLSQTALEDSGSAKEEGLAPAETEDNSTGVNQDFQQEMEVGGEQPSGQESRRGSQQAPNGESPLLPGQPAEEALQSADEVEKLVCSRLSEATLLSIENPDMDDGPVEVYNVVSLEKGSWVNVKTGKLLASQSQQTEAPPAEDDTSVTAPSQKPPEEGQVDTL